MSLLRELLENNDLFIYYNSFVDVGYDDLIFLKTRSIDELNHITLTLISMKPGHSAKFIYLVHNLNKTVTSGDVVLGKNSTYIGIVFDRSGSMSNIINDAIGGYNNFIKEQQKMGNCVVSVVKFDNEINVVHQNINISKIPVATVLDFSPRGSTALLDSIKYTIDMADRYINDQMNKPDKVMIVILTDGQENCSTLATRKQIFSSIREHETKYKWEFVFLSANKDAIKAGVSMGMKSTNCIDWSRQKSDNVFYAASSNATRYRNGEGSKFSQDERNDCL